MNATSEPEPLQALNGLLARLREKVSLYRERLPEGPLRTMEDIGRLPFTTKEDFRANYPFGLFAVPRKDVVRLHMSSGTTGRPVVTGYTRHDLALWAECMGRVMEYAGVTSNDVVQNAYGYGLFTGGMGLHLGAEAVGATVVPTSSGVTQRQVMLMRDLGTTVLCCTPSYALVLAEALHASGGHLDTRLRVGIFGAEPWSDGMRRQIETRLDLEAFDIYGLTELGGPGVAAECSRHDGLHIFEDHFYAEVVDPDTGTPLQEGQPGELVLTSLRREASPVVRYRTRDRTVLTSEPCACGSPYRRFLRVQGRTDDMLVVRGENVFPSQIEELLAGFGGFNGQYILVIDRQAHALDTLEVVLEADTADEQGLEQEIRDRIRDSIGLRITAKVLRPGVLPRSEGKAKRVVDHREAPGGSGSPP
ncbi:MAG: phenylacetate--CoA ligase [Chloroflexi bacterium]|nr:MAG: phenylacetate--CoA ligase [Chloroflexota bacterium]